MAPHVGMQKVWEHKMSRADKRQAKYDAIISRNSRAENRRHSRNAQHRGMSGHPSHPEKRTGWDAMSDAQLQAHGMVRTRGLFGGIRISSMETHQDKIAERNAERDEKRKARRDATAAKRTQQKKARKAKAKARNSRKGKGFFSW